MRKDHGSQEYYRVLCAARGDQVTIIVTQSNSNLFLLYMKEIRISLQKNDFYHSSFTSQMVIISMNLDWRANEHTEKLPISR